MTIYNQTIPYFYIIRNKKSGIMYAGSKWKQGSHPVTFMTEDGYQTSSNTIKTIIKDFGLGVFEILRIDTYCDGLHVYDYETLFLETNNCANSENWYNKHNNNFATNIIECESYQVKNIAQIPYISEKIKKTNLEKYGYENVFGSPTIQDKIKQTNLEKYGYEYTLQVPEIREKGKTTNLEKYGHEQNFKSSEFREMVSKKCLTEHGVTSYAKVPEVREKTKQTNLERFGVECVLQAPEIKKKALNTIKQKYHKQENEKIVNIFQIEEIKEKSKKTKLEKYGVDHQSKREKTCKYCGQYKNIQHEHLCKNNPDRKLNRLKGDDNPKTNARSYKLQAPNGTIHEVKGRIVLFCKENGFDWGMLRKKKSHKGWVLLSSEKLYNKTQK